MYPRGGFAAHGLLACGVGGVDTSDLVHLGCRGDPVRAKRRKSGGTLPQVLTLRALFYRYSACE